MLNITTWNYNVDIHIRSVEINGEVWFVGKDIADALGYGNSRDAVSAHVDEEDRRVIQKSEFATLENHIPKEALNANFVRADIPNRGLTVINESGLYALIFGSKLPDAKKFKHWVTHEVLPTIRKTGSYTYSDDNSYSPLLQLLMEHERKARDIEEQVTQLRDTMSISRENWRKPFDNVCRKIAADRFGDISMAVLIWDEIFEMVDARAHANTKQRMMNIRKRMKEQGYPMTKIRKVNRFNVIEQDNYLLDNLVEILRELTAKYNL